MPRRVLYVSATGRIAGAERSLLILVQALDTARWQPVAAVPRDGPLGPRLAALGAKVFPIPPVRFRRRPGPGEAARTAWAWGRATAATATVARQCGIDLIHSNNTAAHLIALPAALTAHVPAVWHVRDMHPLRLLGPALAPATQGIIFVSSAVRWTACLPERPGAIARAIPNAIDADAFESMARPGELRRELAIGTEAPLLLMAAQMVPWKGHETFIRAVGLLRDRHPGLTAVIAGEDMFGEHADYEASLHALVGELGLLDTLYFLGHRDDMATLMSDCDVLAVPSQGEPFGRVALEAMAVGRPVVGTTGGGLSEVIADGCTGCLVPQRDAQAMARAIASVLADPALRRSMGEHARRRVRRLFTTTRHAAAIEQLYNDVLQAR